MTLSDFRGLSFGTKIGLLFRDGTALLSRPAGYEHRVLFSLHTYYVEVGWDKAGDVQSIRAFAHTNGLEPYLDQLDWHELA